MNFIFALILLLKVVASLDDNTFTPVYIRKYPSIKILDKGQFQIDFQIVFTKEFKFSKDVISSPLSLILAPPPSLKFIKEAVPLTTLSTEIIKDDVDHQHMLPSSSNKYDLNDFDFSSCEKDNALQTLFSLKAKFSNDFGIVKKYDIYDEIRKPKSNHYKTVLLTDSSNFNTFVKGTYTWSGIFELRQYSRTLMDVEEYFEDFVLALGRDHAYGSSEDALCLTYNKFGATEIFKYAYEKNITLITCNSFDASEIKGFSDLDKVDKPEFSAKYTYDRGIDTFYLNLNVKLDSLTSNFANKFYYLIINVPKQISDSTIFEKGCNSQLESNVPFYCEFDKEKSQIQLYATKSALNLSEPTSLKFDVTDLFKNYKSTGEDYSIELYTDYPFKSNYSKTGIKLDVERAASKNLKCVEPVTSLIEKRNNYFKNKRILITKSSTKSYADNFIKFNYKIIKSGENVLMKIYINNHKLLESKKEVVLSIYYKTYYAFEKPDVFDKLTYDYLPSNDGVEFSYDKMAVKLDFSENKTIDEKKYFEVPVVFKTKLSHEDLKNPQALRFTLEDTSTETVIQGVPSYVTSNLSKTDTVRKGATSLDVSTYVDEKPTIVLRLKTVSSKSMAILFDFKNPQNILSYKHRITSTFRFEESVKQTTNSFYKIGIKQTVDDGTDMDMTIELDIIPTEKKFSFDSIVVSVVSNPGDMNYIFDEKDVLIKKVIKLTSEDYTIGRPEPCLTKDTRFSSSRFRSFENLNYFFVKSVDCDRPWLPFRENLGSTLDITVGDGSVVYDKTLVESFSHSNPLQSKILDKLVESRRFYEHFLYMLFDDTAVDVIKSQMIAAGVCKKGDSTCPDNKHIPVLTKLIGNLFPLTDTAFSNVIVGYYTGKKLELYLARDNKMNVNFSKPLEISNLKSLRMAYESLFDFASANSHSDKMGASYSVLSVINKKHVENIQFNLKEYESPIYNRSVNGKYSNPTYVHVIPVDASSKHEVKSKGCTSTPVKMSSENAIDDYNMQMAMADLQLRDNIYTDFKFYRTHKEQKNLSLLETVPSLKGTSGSEQIPFKREDYTFFFRIRDTLKPSCSTKEGIREAPVFVELKEAIKYMSVMPQSYSVIGSCVSFKSDATSKKQIKYSLAFRGEKLGEYLISPNPDVPEKLYSECDMLSLYKYMPNSPYFVSTEETTPTLPSKIVSNKVELFKQLIEGENFQEQQKV